MKLIGVSAAIVAALSLGLASSEPITIWPHSETHVESNERRRLIGERMSNQRLSSLKTAHFFVADSAIYETISEGLEIDFGIPNRVGGMIRETCNLKKGNPVVPQALQEKYEDSIQLFHCLTADFGELNIVFDKTRIDGLKATFFTKDRRTFYVDSALRESAHYVIYETSAALREGLPPVFDSVEGFEDLALLEQLGLNEGYGENRRLERSERKLAGFDAFKFKLAPLTNRQYSSFHGNTKESVLAEIINCFTRVNGIYSNEMAVYLELIEDADLGICLEDDPRSPCNRLGNSGSVINIALDVLGDLGVDSDSYDIGHVLTTGSGGLAALASLCTRRKASGTTGLPQPFTDVYYVDYVAHEIGHQLNGGHVFRDCAGRFDGNLMQSSAAEPGSGSSIMGYAGICGSNNIQRNSDAYFNNLNQEQMRDFIVSAAADSNCGETLIAGVGLPELTVPSKCTVPVGNFIQLVGDSTSQQDLTYFSWDRVDNGYEDFDSTTLGAFRSWMPTKSRQRFLPNLHALNFPGEQSFDVEKLPTQPQTMTFRFMERRIYETSAVSGSFDGTLMGDFVFEDTQVEFVNNPAIKLFNVQRENFIAGQELTVQWSGLTGSNMEVEVRIAVNEMEDINDAFVYERDVIDLSWETLATAPMSAGSAQVTVPSNLAGQPVNLMIRSKYKDNDEGCFFFDMAAGIEVLASLSVPPEEEASSSKAPKGLFVIIVGVALMVLGAVEYKFRHKSEGETEVVEPNNQEITEERVKGVTKPIAGKFAVVNPMVSEV